MEQALTPGLAVSVHFHLRKKVWVVTAREGAFKGKVIAYRDTVSLAGVTWKVSEAARQSVLRKQERQVHAWAYGTIAEAPSAELGRIVSYNPYRAPTFTDQTGAPVYSSAAVSFTNDGRPMARAD